MKTIGKSIVVGASLAAGMLALAGTSQRSSADSDPGVMTVATAGGFSGANARGGRIETVGTVGTVAGIETPHPQNLSWNAIFSARP